MNAHGKRKKCEDVAEVVAMLKIAEISLKTDLEAEIS